VPEERKGICPRFVGGCADAARALTAPCDSQNHHPETLHSILKLAEPEASRLTP